MKGGGAFCIARYSSLVSAGQRFRSGILPSGAVCQRLSFSCHVVITKMDLWTVELMFSDPKVREATSDPRAQGGIVGK